MPVSSTHPEYDKYAAEWQRNQIAFDGEMAIKDNAKEFYPEFTPSDPERYDAVIKSSYFKEVTSRTVIGLQGSVFRKDPTFELPARLAYMAEDADGMGNSLIQMAKSSFNQAMLKGREILLVDMPPVPAGATSDQVQALNLRPAICKYTAESVINWKTVRIGSKTLLSMLVLKETYDAGHEDEYTENTQTRYRVYRLMKDGVWVSLHDSGGKSIGEPYQPLMSDRSPWRIIPAVFIGSESNTTNVDKPPISGVASINIAQYRNIVDHEENLHMHGQLTAGVTSDMSNAQWQEIHGSGFRLGSHVVQFLGQNGGFHQLQVPENSALANAIKEKDDTMVMLGARLITPITANETVDGVAMRAGAETSILNTVVGNISEAYEQALEYAGMFIGADSEAVKFQLNTEFFALNLPPQAIMAIIQLRDMGDIAQSDLRNLLRKSDLLSQDRTDEEIDNEVAQNPPGL